MIEYDYKGYKIRIEDNPKTMSLLGTIIKDDYYGRIEREYKKTVHKLHEASYSLLSGYQEETETSTEYDRNGAIVELYHELIMCVDLISIGVQHEEEKMRTLYSVKAKACDEMPKAPDRDFVASLCFGPAMMLRDEERLRREREEAARRRFEDGRRLGAVHEVVKRIEEARDRDTSSKHQIALINDELRKIKIDFGLKD